MKKVYITLSLRLVCLFFLTGCGGTCADVEVMSNEEIIKQKNICEDGGMDHMILSCGYTVVRVTCITKQDD